MILTVTQTQAWQVQKLLCSCCNWKEGNCLLHDDGEPHRCMQLQSLYGIFFEYFAESVLPVESELYEEIQKQNNLK